MHAQFTSSDGLSLGYHLDDFTPPWNPGEPLLLLHSMMGRAERYFSWVPRLASEYRVIRHDMRGHGRSEVPRADQELSMERLMRDALELLDHLGIERCHVVANSAGGYVAQWMAMYAPARVKSLTLFGSTPGLLKSGTDSWIPLIRKEGLLPFLTRTISDRFPLDRVPKGLVDWFLENSGACDQAYICRFLAMTTSMDWGPELHRIQCPTLVVRPGGETVGGADHYDVYKEQVRDCELLTYHGYPHNICDIVPQLCVTDVLAFLERRFPKR